jgi:hypothetical protein
MRNEDYSQSNPLIKDFKKGTRVTATEEDEHDLFLNDKMLDSSMIKKKKKTKLHLSTHGRPNIEMGSLNLMKSERDVTHLDQNIFQSDRTLGPFQDKSYKLIQNKNGKPK